MKYIYQLGIILVFSALGEALHTILPGPVPASIYGFLLLLICLYLKVIRLDMVENTGVFLIGLLPLILTPVSVGILKAGDALREMLVPTIVVSVVTTILMMGVTARVTQYVIQRRRRKNESTTG